MLIAIVSTLVFLYISAYLGTCDLVLVDEDKGQAQIPIPQIGRTDSSNWLPQNQILVPGVDRRESSTSYWGHPPNYHSLTLISTPLDVEMLNEGSESRNALLVPQTNRAKRSLGEASSRYSGLQKVKPFSSSSYSHRVMAIEELLRRKPFAILTLKGIDKKMAFSPRLGRAMVPRLGKKSLDDSNTFSEMDKRAAFSPRLGRSEMSTEQDVSDDIFSVESRAAFSPRLGRGGSWGWRWGRGNVYTRAIPFSPRLGRSYT